MKILIPCDDVQNAYLPSLVEAYQECGHEVLTGVANFFQTAYRPDILHLQWPEVLYYAGEFNVFGEPLETILKRLTHFKQQGSAIVWTIHNTQPHGDAADKIDTQVYKAIVDHADILVHHGEASLEIMKSIYPQVADKTNVVCPHGDYLLQFEEIDRNSARRSLDIPQDRMVLLSFGRIRSYKGFNLVPQVFAGWQAENKYLMVAGNYKRNSFRLSDRLFRIWHGRLRNRTRTNGYDLKTIPANRVGLYFSAADILLLTHTSGLTSGIIAMAATFGKPVVYPLIGNFSEQMNGWVAEGYEVGNVDAARIALNTLTSRITAGEELDNARWLERNSWSLHVRRIVEAVDHQDQPQGTEA